MKFNKLKPKVVDDRRDFDGDVEDPESFPMVLVQIPMCNEREVFISVVFNCYLFCFALWLMR